MPTAPSYLAVLFADASTLEVVGRHEFDLPATPHDRVFNDMQVDDRTAYLAAWGFGLIVADVSDPRAPAEVARLPAAFAHSVAVANARGGVLYVAGYPDGSLESVGLRNHLVIFATDDANAIHLAGRAGRSASSSLSSSSGSERLVLEPGAAERGLAHQPALDDREGGHALLMAGRPRCA